MPNNHVPAAVTGLPASTEAHGHIPVDGHATIIPADRREFLRRLAAASVLTIPVAAAAFVHGDPDAELARLGADFERHYAEYLVLYEESDRVCALVDDEGERMGLKPGGLAWLELRKQRNVDAAIKISNEKAELLDDIADRIRAIPAVGIAGLAVKVSLLPFDMHNMGDEIAIKNGLVDDLDLGTERLHSFIAEVHTVARGSHV